MLLGHFLAWVWADWTFGCWATWLHVDDVMTGWMCLDPCGTGCTWLSPGHCCLCLPTLLRWLFDLLHKPCVYMLIKINCLCSIATFSKNQKEYMSSVLRQHFCLPQITCMDWVLLPGELMPTNISIKRNNGGIRKHDKVKEKQTNKKNIKQKPWYFFMSLIFKYFGDRIKTNWSTFSLEPLSRFDFIFFLIGRYEMCLELYCRWRHYEGIEWWKYTCM